MNPERIQADALTPKDTPGWRHPACDLVEFKARRSRYCLCIFVLNECARLRSQLHKMRDVCRDWDTLLVDGGSEDGSNDHGMLQAGGIRALLIKRGPGRLGAQMQMAFAYALQAGYGGVITVDGNDKDDVSAGLPHFVEKLDQGFDHIQGSRFLPGGRHRNTPRSRLLGVRLLHAPLISLASGFRHTDTTNGFRAYSRHFLTRPEICRPGSLRTGYELHYFLSLNAVRHGTWAIEVPVTRIYPDSGLLPTKIHGWRGNLRILLVLLKEVFGHIIGQLIFCPRHRTRRRQPPP
ncbi:MAG: glycosyltransferase family 2 protein [Kiritimatiellia bacterium]|nr:glycosyltransferase family 2 protein [Lentisphaerota bacterium]